MPINNNPHPELNNKRSILILHTSILLGAFLNIASRINNRTSPKLSNNLNLLSMTNVVLSTLFLLRHISTASISTPPHGKHISSIILFDLCSGLIATSNLISDSLSGQPNQNINSTNNIVQLSYCGVSAAVTCYFIYCISKIKNDENNTNSLLVSSSNSSPPGYYTLSQPHSPPPYENTLYNRPLTPENTAHSDHTSITIHDEGTIPQTNTAEAEHRNWSALTINEEKQEDDDDTETNQIIKSTYIAAYEEIKHLIPDTITTCPIGNTTIQQPWLQTNGLVYEYKHLFTLYENNPSEHHRQLIPLKENYYKDQCVFLMEQPEYPVCCPNGHIGNAPEFYEWTRLHSQCPHKCSESLSPEDLTPIFTLFHHNKKGTQTLKQSEQLGYTQ